MKIVSKLSFGLTRVVLSACTPSTPATLLDIQVGRTTFVFNGHSYATTAELTTALKTLSPPDGINLIHTEGATPERINEAIAAVKNPGIQAPIGWVVTKFFIRRGPPADGPPLWAGSGCLTTAAANCGRWKLSELKQISELFHTASYEFPLDRSFEPQLPAPNHGIPSDPENNRKFSILQKLN